MPRSKQNAGHSFIIVTSRQSRNALYGGHESQVCWTVEALEELKWWRDHLSAWNERACFIKPSSTDNRDRCLHNGRGLWSQSERLLFKLFRASSRWICAEVMSKKQVQYPCKANDGQYNSNKLETKWVGQHHWSCQA